MRTEIYRDIRVFSFNVGMLLVRAGGSQFTDGLLHWQQHVLQFSLLTEDEVELLIQPGLIDLHTFYVGVKLSDLHIHISNVSTSSSVDTNKHCLVVLDN